MPTVVVYTPEGYQVTDKAAFRIAEHFDCDTIMEAWDKGHPVLRGALHITDQECKRGMIVADVETGRPIEDMTVLSIYEAMAMVDPKIGKCFSDEISDGADRKSMRIPAIAKGMDVEFNPGSVLDALIDTCHNASYAAGWWHHPDTGLPYIPGDRDVGGTTWGNIPKETREMIIHYWPFVVATKIGLFHSEVSEGFEAYRRGQRDDKLAHRLGLETEIADTMIRQFDLAGAFKRANALGIVDASTHEMDLSASFFEKLSFNRDRPDHKVAARRATGGKMF